MAAPVLIKPIPHQIVNEQAAYGPFDLKDFFQSPDGTPIGFVAELKTGQALPRGMICTSDGILTGIPAKDTHGNYEISITATSGLDSMQASFVFTIKPSLTANNMEYIDKLKAQVWQALEEHLPVPELADIYERPITALDIYYLLERWGTLTIYDAFNLEPPGEKKLLVLEDASPHYDVYDRGSCLVGCPRDLYSHERTIADSIQTAKAMANVAFNRGWTMELIGIEKMTRTAWVEIQRLNEQFKRNLEVINFAPTSDDVKLYVSQAEQDILKGKIDLE